MTEQWALSARISGRRFTGLMMAGATALSLLTPPAQAEGPLLTPKTGVSKQFLTVGEVGKIIAQVVQDNAVGFLAGTKSNYVFVNYYIPNNLTTPAMVCSAGTCTQNSAITFPYSYTVNTVSGNTTGRSLSGTATTPQRSQWMTGIGVPQ